MPVAHHASLLIFDALEEKRWPRRKHQKPPAGCTSRCSSSPRGESWELQSRIDTEAGRAIYQSLARHRPVDAVDAVVEEEAEPEPSAAPALDVETGDGLQALKRLLRRVEPAEVFATIRAGREGRATARVLRRGSRRLLAAATASDEATLRGVLREILPNVMLDVAMKPPG